jgi:transcriptional regulator with GAF, ATPase, and Fis domain
VRLHKVVTTIGAAAGNDVVLADPGVAPSHATLLRQGGTWTVAAVDRQGRLLVDGVSTRRAPLADGGVVTLGLHEIVLHDGDPQLEPADDDAPLGMLERLVALSADMMRDTSPERLFATLLESVVSLTGAERGFVVLLRDGARHVAAAHNVRAEQIHLSRVSDSIVDRVIDTQEPVIVSDALHDSRFDRAQSVVDLRLSSVMCVPLLWQEDLLGVLYLGNDAVQGLFTDRDLAVLRVFATHASMVAWNALLLNRLRLDNDTLRRELDRAEHGEIVGSSPPMREVYRIVGRIAPTDLSVLVLGETGTGKELVARAIHAGSPRAKGPFVAINCGAIHEGLLESELFGHRKGAFTGADADKVGKIEAASGGTLFLDEIGEMPTALQVKLLRVLQERTIERVGEVQPRPVDLRVVAATHRDPEQMIRLGTFREDLYYRLNEVTLRMPALRERGEDIVLLARFFLDKYRARYEGRARGFTHQALVGLKASPWPGNVRQLENAVKKAVILADRPLVGAADLGLAEEPRAPVVPLAEAREAFTHDYVRRALDRNHGNKAQTARELGVDVRTVFRVLERADADGEDS